MNKAFHFVTGSSASGKTTLLKCIGSQLADEIACFYFDEVDTSDLTQWMQSVLAAGKRLSVLDGSMRPTEIKRTAGTLGVDNLKITLIDCNHHERRRRLLDNRKQPELDTLDIYAWAAYLRGQADALGLEVIDTSTSRIEESSSELLASIQQFALKVSLAA